MLVSQRKVFLLSSKGTSCHWRAVHSLQLMPMCMASIRTHDRASVTQFFWPGMYWIVPLYSVMAER